MTSWRRPLATLAFVAVAVAVAVMPGASFASGDTGTTVSPDPSGPQITSTVTTASKGDLVQVVLSKFAAPIVTLSVCGNEGAQGSTDCDLAHTVSYNLNADGSPTPVQITVGFPPVPCPCVIQASSDDGLEVATLPLVLRGHPSSAVVAPDTSTTPDVGLDVSITATQVRRGLWRRAVENLGGAMSYDLDVVVHNVSTANMNDLVLLGTASRGGKPVLTSLPLARPDSLAPGQRWAQLIRVDMPAPTLGDVTWQVTVTHNGVPVMATAVSRHRPWLLIAVLVFLVVDVAALLIRSRMRAKSHAKQALASVSNDTLVHEPPAASAGGIPVDHHGFAPEDGVTDLAPHDPAGVGSVAALAGESSWLDRPLV